MTDKSEIDREIELFISDWYYKDAKSHRYARELGKFLFQFLDSLERQGLSEKTIQKHTDNCWMIGMLECNYGYRAKFSPGAVFGSPEADYESEFARKMSDSNYAINSYRSTWRKLYKYTKDLSLIE